MGTLAGFKVTRRYKCIFPTCTDAWCDANCNHHPKYCPASFCRGIPTSSPPPPPTPPPTAAPGTCPAGSLLGTSWWNTAEEKTSSPYALICCPAECGTCAGEGCGSREGGAKNCCAKKITPANQKCSETGTAPCVLGSPPADTPTTEMYKHRGTLAGFKVT